MGTYGDIYNTKQNVFEKVIDGMEQIESEGESQEDLEEMVGC